MGSQLEDISEVHEGTTGMNGKDRTASPRMNRFGSSMSQNDDPACIVGMACRLPGGVNSPSKLWDTVAKKLSHSGPVPPSRFDMSGWQHPDRNRAGVMDVPGGYFLQEDVRQYDAGFFGGLGGIHNLEAAGLDPQQRKLLEVVYECFEHAGVTLQEMAGSNTGVYVGNFTLDHATMQLRDPDTIGRYTAIGVGTSLLANRVSYVFDLQGPSQVLDTACSSSLYCLHNAVQAVVGGECDGAIVAGSNLIMSPEQCVGTARAGFLSPTATCHTFDADADGYARAEGVNAIYIKRLSAAVRDGDKVWAVIRGTAVNANGRTSGISQPNADRQQAVIRKAYAAAKLDVLDTDYVEFHGTGTPIGDPIEVEAVARCFSQQRGSRLMIGASKPNFGHSEAASGLTAIIKAALALDMGKIPPTCGIKKLNPKLQIDSRNLAVVQEMAAWPRALRRVSVNSFGYGGANSHSIMESLNSYLGLDELDVVPDRIESSEKKAIIRDQRISEHTCHFVFPISAATSHALETRINQVIETIAQLQTDSHQIEHALQDLAYTLAQRRSHMDFRQALLFKMTAMSGGKPEVLRLDVEGESKDPVTGHNSKPLPFGFVFTGQGAQWAEMGKQLLETDSAFATTIRNLDRVLQRLPNGQAPNWSLEQTLLDPPEFSQIHHVNRSQPVCTALQIALVDMLAIWGVQPTAVVGHSSGEIAAAYAAGLLSADQAILTAYFRGMAVGTLHQQGAMMAAALGPKAARQLIQESDLIEDVCIGCVNSPESVTLSGSAAGIEIFLAKLQEQNTFARKLQTGGRAYHSFMMKEAGALYEDLLVPYLSPGASAGSALCNDKKHHVPMFSSVGVDAEHMAVADITSTMSVKYWRKNLERPVQFWPAVQNMMGVVGPDGKGLHLVEIGPHSALKGPLRQIRTHMGLEESAMPYSCALFRGQDADASVKSLSITLFRHGTKLAWQKINTTPGLDANGRKPKLVHLKPYPWDYSGGLLWTEPRASIETRNRSFIRHPLLGSLRVAGNGLDWHWKNQLSLKEIPWLRHHRVETQIVFPGAGFLAVGIEGLSQIIQLRHKSGDNSNSNAVFGRPRWFEFRNVNISAALVVPDDEDETVSTEPVELHTAISPRALSTTTNSADWYDFSISSWVAGQARAHCAGSIRAHEADDAISANIVTVQRDHSLEQRATGSAAPYYRKFEQEGLCLGPSFQSISKVDGNRSCSAMLATTLLRPQEHLDAQLNQREREEDAIHPITIDACIQAGIMSTAAGDINDLGAHIPVSIRECWIRSDSKGDDSNSPIKHPQDDALGAELATIEARARKTGVSTHRVDATLRHPQTAVPLVHMQDVLVSHYRAKMPSSDLLPAARQPCLRVAWKPDLQHLRAGSGSTLAQHLAAFVGRLPDALPDSDLPENPGAATVAALLDLSGHRNPRMRVLELGEACDCKAQQWMAALGKGTGSQRFHSWETISLGVDGQDAVAKAPVYGSDGSVRDAFDVVLLTSLKNSREYWAKNSNEVVSLIAEGGIVITRAAGGSIHILKKEGFSVFEIGNGFVCGVHSKGKTTHSLEGKPFVIITRKALPCPRSEKFAEAIATQLQKQVSTSDVKIVPLEDATEASLSEDMICISLLEVEDEFLSSMSQDDMNHLRSVTSRVTTLLWLTGANMLGSKPKPGLALCNGLARALMLEQPALRFLVMDIGTATQWNSPSTHENIVSVLAGCTSTLDGGDSEFVQHDGLVHISRFVPDSLLNATFNRRLGTGSRAQDQESIQRTSLAKARPAQLSISRVGVSETIHFQAIEKPHVGGAEPPPAGSVDVLVKAVSLNAKNVYSLNGRVETLAASTAEDFSGIVTAVGPGVTNLRPGHRVFGCAPGKLATTMRMRATDAHRMLDTESFCTMPTLLAVYATALYALHDRAHLRANETVLIHGGAGAFGFAAITIAKRLGAIVYTTAGSVNKRRFITRELGIPPERVFNSRDRGFVEGLRQVTNGRMADVVVNFLVGDLLHESWRCVAPFGRFVEVGKRELVDAGRLDMDVFLRNATFTAFDLTDLMMHEDDHYRQVWHRLNSEVVDLYRAGEIKPPPITTFDVADIVQAYRYFSTPDRVGKVVISFENDESLIPFAPRRYGTALDPNKTYLLIGCLGGLGRSLSRWLLSRGARDFVFLGRSGMDKKSAKDMVRSLEAGGASVTVVRGDVTNLQHVEAAVAACVATGKPLGGVIQAAMGLHEGLFSSMTSEAWHTAIQPKVTGTWNLNAALEAGGHDASLDFFLLLSSVSGSVGTATESNYCAANCFLDAFADWRRAHGKPAISLGLGMISEVGYLHENPEIEALLLRRGIQPLTEVEFLQTIDLALSGASEQIDDSTSHHDRAQDLQSGSAHILTGLEPLGVFRLKDQGFDVTHASMDDPRASILFAALSAETDARDKAQAGIHGAASTGGGGLTRAAWYANVPETAEKALQAEAHVSSLQVAVLNLLRKRFSSLILVSPDKISEDKSLANFGVDSMIASEFRTWIWTSFKVDVPFLDILGQGTALNTLATSIAARLGDSK